VNTNYKYIQHLTWHLILDWHGDLVCSVILQDLLIMVGILSTWFIKLTKNESGCPWESLRLVVDFVDLADVSKSSQEN